MCYKRRGVLNGNATFIPHVYLSNAVSAVGLWAYEKYGIPADFIYNLCTAKPRYYQHPCECPNWFYNGEMVLFPRLQWDLSWEYHCHIRDRLSWRIIFVAGPTFQFNWKTTCLERPYCLGQPGGLSKQPGSTVLNIENAFLLLLRSGLYSEVALILRYYYICIRL